MLRRLRGLVLFHMTSYEEIESVRFVSPRYGRESVWDILMCCHFHLVYLPMHREQPSCQDSDSNVTRTAERESAELIHGAEDPSRIL